MRFFFELVSCCGSSTRLKSHPALPAEEEQKCLVQPPPLIAPRSLRLKRRGRMSGRRHSWRPSLGSISEEIVVSPAEISDPSNGAGGVSTRRDVKRRSSCSRGAAAVGAAKARHRSYSHGDYRGAATPMIMASLAPTPFMF